MTPNSESTLSWFRLTTGEVAETPAAGQVLGDDRPDRGQHDPDLHAREDGRQRAREVDEADPLDRLACRVAARSRWSGSTDRMPAWVPTTIGKKANMAATATFELVPKPNQSRSSGMIATLGSTWNATM